jgi:hypothetical protein
VARSLNSLWHLIPAGATDTTQPLDSCLFGAIKGEPRAKLPSRSGRGRLAEARKRDFILQLLAAWDTVKQTTLARARATCVTQ